MLPDFLGLKVLALLGFLGYELLHLLVWDISLVFTHQSVSGTIVRREGFFPVLERDKVSVLVEGLECQKLLCDSASIPILGGGYSIGLVWAGSLG